MTPEDQTGSDIAAGPPVELRPTSDAQSGSMLPPAWIAILSVYWRSKPPRDREVVLDLVRTACAEPNTEQSVYLAQQALRRLSMIEIQIIRLILARYVEHVQLGSPRPAQAIAAELLSTLQFLSRARRRTIGCVAEFAHDPA